MQCLFTTNPSSLSNNTYHLKSINVKVGDYVDQNTQIGVMGGSKSTTPWDTCSTGTHLHFAIARGLYLKEYSSWKYLLKFNEQMKTINISEQ